MVRGGVTTADKVSKAEGVDVERSTVEGAKGIDACDWLRESSMRAKGRYSL
jgi:hypothetical protein